MGDPGKGTPATVRVHPKVCATLTAPLVRPRPQPPDLRREIAARLGEDRNDFETEFGPTNVEIHAVSTAVELGDAGPALEVARQVDASTLSPERQARFLLDVAREHAQRRHVGEAAAALLEAESLAPEQVHDHYVAREVIRDLSQLSGRRVPESLRDLAERCAIG
ncbi:MULTISPECIES: hypothetical protein [unclassified Streptomyces]|uniref:hypothetical protein n=1 Tax=unclassified Streptomyces TaxID=2593676 RepID=UPI00037D882C|nr:MULTISPECIES: hypothetical protein [unclassified Streptomyces]